MIKLNDVTYDDITYDLSFTLNLCSPGKCRYKESQISTVHTSEKEN